LGRNNSGINAFVYYDINSNIKTDLSIGLQNSSVLTTPIDNPYYSLTKRENESSYIYWRTQAHGFNSMVTFSRGSLDPAGKKNEFMVDYGNLDVVLEYEYQYKNLTLRPGISWRNAVYSDEENVDVDLKEGFLNGSRTLNSFAYSLRADYTAFEKLRLVAAIRGDKYSYPDKTYLTYQGIASYKLNDKNLVRFVAARANRSSFVIDTYADFDWHKVTLESNPVLAAFLTSENGSHFYFSGNKELELATMDMIEVGYRMKPHKKVQVDIEAFQTKTESFNWFELDSLKLLVINAFYNHPQAGPVPVDTTFVPYDVHFSYKNSSVISKQSGISITIKTVINEKLYFNVFGTLQQTKLENYRPLTVEQSLQTMMQEAGQLHNALGLPSDPVWISDTTFVVGMKFATDQYPPGIGDTYTDTDHKWTPAFYGGFRVNYKPIDKLNVNASIYTYGKQTFIHSFETQDVDSKIILNAKISYNFWKDTWVYVNLRNALNDRSREFPFVDDIGGLYLVGLNMNF